MFEQSVLPSVAKGKRFWTTCAGVSGQVLLVTVMVMAPMLWPQVLPPATFVMVVPHAPAGHHDPGKPKAATVAHNRPTHLFQMRNGILTQPTVVPPRIEIITDAPDANTYGAFVPGAFGPGDGNGPGGGILPSIISD